MSINELIGKQVVKPSGKKFKSGNAANTVTGIVDHYITKNLSFTFAEDDSIVEVHRVILLEDSALIQNVGPERKSKVCREIHTRYNDGVPLTVHKVDKPSTPKPKAEKPPKLPTYDRLQKLSIDEVFEAITENRFFIFGGKECSPLGDRVRTYYEHGVKCVRCDTKGQYFAVERFTYMNGKLNTNTKYHLNFYGLNKVGKEVMMTVDHIHTKAEGGKDCIENYQPMCEVCNKRKGGEMTEADIEALKARGVIFKNDEDDK